MPFRRLKSGKLEISSNRSNKLVSVSTLTDGSAEPHQPSLSPCLPPPAHENRSLRDLTRGRPSLKGKHSAVHFQATGPASKKAPLGWAGLPPSLATGRGHSWESRFGRTAAVVQVVTRPERGLGRQHWASRHRERAGKDRGARELRRAFRTRPGSSALPLPTQSGLRWGSTGFPHKRKTSPFHPAAPANVRLGSPLPRLACAEGQRDAKLLRKGGPRAPCSAERPQLLRNWLPKRRGSWSVAAAISGVPVAESSGWSGAFDAAARCRESNCRQPLPRSQRPVARAPFLAPVSAAPFPPSQMWAEVWLTPASKSHLSHYWALLKCSKRCVHVPPLEPRALGALQANRGCSLTRPSSGFALGLF